MFVWITDLIHQFDTMKDLSVEIGVIAIIFLYVTNH